MKKIALVIAGLFVFVTTSFAQTASSDYMGLGMPGPLAEIMCKRTDTESATDETISSFGYSPGGVYTPLIEMRTRQLLTEFSGDEIGRGAIRLHDTLSDPVRQFEVGFYEFGAGLFTDAPVLEIWAQDVSIRQLTGSTPAILEVRDPSDTKNIAFRSDGTIGQIYTSGQTFPDGALSLRPLANETFLFNGRTGAGKGNITQNATYGGSLVLTNNKTAVFQPINTSITAVGTTIADAYQLFAVYNNVTTAAAGTGVKLWEPNDSNETPTTKNGVNIKIVNRGANDIVVYPPTAADSINAGTAGHGIALTAANDQVATCFKISSANWQCTVANSATVL